MYGKNIHSFKMIQRADIEIKQDGCQILLLSDLSYFVFLNYGKLVDVCLKFSNCLTGTLYWGKSILGTK